MSTPTELSTTQAILFVFLGIILSVILPIATEAIRKMKPLEGKPLEGFGGFGSKLKAAWTSYRGNKYLIFLFGTAVVAFVIVFLLGMRFYTPRDAALAGFAWE